MQVQLETLSNLERRLNISLPMATIDAQIVERLKRVARSARIQGFRPGKAPLKIVEMNYGAQVRDEVLNEQVQQGFYNAAAEQKLRIAGYPRFEAVAQDDSKEHFKFAASFEVYPEVTVGELDGKEIEKPVTEVGDAEIEKTVDILRKQRTRFNHVERAAADGDRVIIDFSGTIDGEAFEGGSAENYPFVIGQGQMLPEFEAGAIGLKEGENREVSVTFPEDYQGKDVAGKTALFNISVKNVAEAILPEIDEEFAKTLGIADGNVEKMWVEVRKNVEREAKRRLQARTKENVMQALLDATPIDLPKALVELEIGRLAEQAQRDMQQRGMDPKNLKLPPALFAKQAERRVALGLILAQIVEANKLEATEEQVKAIIEEFADSYEQPADVLSWYYASPDRLEGPKSTVLENNVVEFVLSKANVVEKALPFDTLMGSDV
ncbi:trigger factor [Neisseriaceae bacterium TC5R-5]|nr:trigger factor [Neisseriaceae bacterium TC5R-5]